MICQKHIIFYLSYSPKMCNLLAFDQRGQCVVHLLDRRPLELQIDVFGIDAILLGAVFPALERILDRGRLAGHLVWLRRQRCEISDFLI